MISLFRTLNPLNIFLLGLLCIILRLGMFLHLPETLTLNIAEPYAWLMAGGPAANILSPMENALVAAVLTMIQAVMLNRVVNNFNILGKPTLLPALMYVTGSSILMPFMILNPVIICNFLSIWMIAKFFGIYHKDEARSVMYDLGMIVAAGTLIYFPFILMILALWISLVIFRPFDWREWTSVLLGFITIYFFVAIIYYLNDSLGQFYHIWLPLANTFPVNFNINPYDYIVLIPVILILVLAAFSIRQNFFRSFVLIRKSFQALFYMFLLGIVSFYLKSDVEIYHFLLPLAPASVFMAYYFVNAKKRWFYETLYLLLAGFIIYFQLV